MLFNYFTISSLINAFTSFGLTGLILVRQPKAEINRIFCLFTFSVGFWSINHFFAFAIQNGEQALFFHRVLMLGAIFIPTTYFHFVCLLLNIYEKRKNIVKWGYVASIFFAISDLTPYFVTSVSDKLYFKFFENPGVFYHPFLLMFIGFTVYSHILLLKGLRKSVGIKQNQIKYVFLGTLIGFLGGSTSFFLVYNIPIPPIGDILVSVYVFLVAFSIIKYRLLDIRLAISNTVIFIGVYFLVLGAPFYTYTLGYHFLSLLCMFVLATTGPIILKNLQSRAEKGILKEQELYQRALFSLSSELDKYETHNEIVQHVAKVLYKSMQLKNFALYLRNNGGLVIQETDTDESSYKKEIKDIHIINWDLKRNKAVLLKELENSQTNGHNYEEFLQLTQAVLVVPLIHHQKLKGFIFLGDKKNGTLFSSSDFIALSGLAHSVAFALEYAGILKERTELLEQKMHDQRLKDLGLFAAKVAHQMGNRLTRITGRLSVFTDYFTEDVLKDLPREKMVVKIKDFISKFDVLIQDALSSSKISSAIKRSSKSGEDAMAIKLKELVDGGRALAEVKHPEFKYEFIEDYDQTLELWVNDTAIQEFFTNAIDNSIDAMKGKQKLFKSLQGYSPQIKVKAIVQDGVGTIEVIDNGKGIAKNEMDKVFVPLWTTKGTDKGSGLGLSTMRDLIEGQGGTIVLTSEQGEWTKITITLPVATDERKQKKENA